MALLFGLSAGALLPIVAMADVIPLAPVPDLNGGVNSLPEYLNAVFRVVIIVGAILAVLRIIWSGFEYMTSEAVGQKKDARGVITAAIGGLILLIATTLILTVINPSIVNLDALNFNNLGTSEPVGEVPSTTGNSETIKSGDLPPKLGIGEAHTLEQQNFATEAEAQAATNACEESVCTVKSVGSVWKIDVDEGTILKTTFIKTDDRDQMLVFENDCVIANGLSTRRTFTVTLSGGTTSPPSYEVTCVK